MTTATDRKQSKWELNGKMLTVTMPNGNITAFDMNDLFSKEDWEKFGLGQKFVIAYGIKQKVSDATNKIDNEFEKGNAMHDTYTALVNDDIGRSSLKVSKAKKADLVMAITLDNSLTDSEKVKKIAEVMAM